ncbi:MAG: hypothetical protein KatS3mg090_0821 [Patescibacteria group bacterium]|nr:MAG: hypothetical protein KatS3mg090_0821 [Patescibacteria group bacterium]
MLLKNSALEPEVDELIAMFQKAGVDIKRLPNDPKTIIANPPEQKNFRLNTEVFVKGDHNEAVSYAVLGLVVWKKD